MLTPTTSRLVRDGVRRAVRVSHGLPADGFPAARTIELGSRYRAGGSRFKKTGSAKQS